MGKLIHEKLSSELLAPRCKFPKVVAAFNEAHVAQMVGYLTIASLELALLLNFKSARLEWKRVVRQQEPVTDAPDLYA